MKVNDKGTLNFTLEFCLQIASQLLLLLATVASAAEWRDPNYHVATDEQMVIRQKDGGIR